MKELAEEVKKRVDRAASLQQDRRVRSGLQIRSCMKGDLVWRYYLPEVIRKGINH